MFSSRNVGIVVSARMGSSRLPGKSLLPLADIPLIIYLLQRLNSSLSPFKLILATTELSQDDPLFEIASSYGFDVFRGHPFDLVTRYCEVINHYNLSHVIRVTGDCPFVDLSLAIQFYDYAFSRLSSYSLITTKGSYPVGLDFELFSSSSLFRLLNSFNIDALEREHLTLAFYNKLPRNVLVAPSPYPDFSPNQKLSFTVDYPEDYKCALDLSLHNSPLFPASSLFYF